MEAADDRVAALLALIAAERNAREAAESAREAAESARDEAVAARAAAEERAELEAENRFASDMKAMSATASDAATHADTSRWDAPSPETSSGNFWGATSDVSREDVRRAWSRFISASSAAARTAQRVSRKIDEVNDVHPVIERALAACLEGQVGLRLFHEKTVHDDIATATAKPDFSIVHARDATTSLLGALVMVEVTLPGDITNAELQACAHGRRRVYKLFKEERARRGRGDTVRAYVVATDGQHVTLARIDSGAPPEGTSWSGRTPCPTVCTDPLELLPVWDGVMHPEPPSDPPEGFSALLRLVLSLTQEVSAGVAPLEELYVSWLPDDGGAADAPAHVVLGECIAHGGTSDVYAIAGVPGCVIKVARFTSAGLVSMYDAEAEALQRLHETSAAASGLLPKLLRRGSRQLPHHSERGLAQRWPVLELTPRGTPLEPWLDEHGGAAGAGGGADNAAGAALASAIQLANHIVGDVVAALADAHAAGLVHCDVRPSNVVIVGGGGAAGGAGGAHDFRAVLVDWGVSRAKGSACSGIGVEAFADGRVFSGKATTAKPVHDYVAAAHLWLCIALGRGRAPWLALPPQHGPTVTSVRAAWLSARAGDPATPQAVRPVLEAAIRWGSDARTGDVTSEAQSLWPPRA